MRRTGAWRILAVAATVTFGTTLVAQGVHPVSGRAHRRALLGFFGLTLGAFEPRRSLVAHDPPRGVVVLPWQHILVFSR